MGPKGHYRKNRRTHFQLSRGGNHSATAKGSRISSYPNYSAPPQPRYVPTQSRANLVCVLLLANAAISFVSGLFSLLELFWPGDMFGEGFEDNPVTMGLGLLVILLTIAQILVYIPTVVVFLMWVYRAHENLAAFGVPKHQLQHSSGWAVGSFFVPLANLIIPYRAITELWRKSVPNQTSMFGELSPPGFFPAWWGFWIASSIVDQIYFRISWREEVPSDATEAIGAIGSVLGIIAAVLAVQVVREIQRQQVESSRLVPTQTTFVSPPAPPQFNQQGNLGASS
jgi:hypothetical protein